jgi:hypothetical protein
VEYFKGGMYSAGFLGFLFEVFALGGKIDQRCNKGLRAEQELWTAFD